MSINYLPTRKSLGYCNVKKALADVFSLNLDELEIHEGDFENFRFELNYNGYNVTMGIVASGKGIQFEAGEGGVFDVSLPNPKYPEDSFLEKVSLAHLVEDPVIKEKVRVVLGKDEKLIDFALQVLKDLLDIGAISKDSKVNETIYENLEEKREDIYTEI